MNEKMNSAKNIELDENWYFHKGDVEGYPMFLGSELAVDTQRDWMKINVPHDWDREGPFLKRARSGTSGGYAPCGIGWYQRLLEIDESYKNKKLFLRFDGIYMRTTLWINKKKIGSHLYGYSPFEIDITDYVDFDGKNVLTISVDNSKQPSCRWYSGSGIFRKAWLYVRNPVYFPSGGVFISTPSVSEAEASVRIQTEIARTDLQDNSKNTGNSDSFNISYQILDVDDNIVSESKQNLINLNSALSHFEENFTIKNPHLWSANSPYLYRAEVVLTKSGEILDSESINIGFRYYAFSAEGFSINGENTILKGVCLHHDGGCVGAAVPIKVWERRFNKLKSMGCNAIRTSHNAPASDYLDLCDKMGFYIIDEAFDKWTHGSPLHDWVRYGFKKTWKTELTSIIRRDRNHPSVILWSMGNEIRQFHKKSNKKWFKRLADLTRSLDSTRPLSAALSPNFAKAELKVKKPPYIADIADVICTNYVEAYAPDFHKRWPNKAIISTEAYHYWRRKHEEREINLPSRHDAKTITEMNPWFDVIKHEYLVGQFLWVGIEYLGEVRDPFPYHGRTNAPIRMNGFKKPQSGFHQSVWSEKPFTHCAVYDEAANIPRGKPYFEFPKIVCHWNFEGRKDIPENMVKVVTFTNCESVELQLNGNSLGEKQSKDFPMNDMKWDVKYEPGELIAIGKNDGKEVSRYQLKTAGVAAALQLEIDSRELKADNHDCAHIEMAIIDENGVLCPFASNKIEIDVTGNGKLIGIDGGDLSSTDPYHGNKCSAYWGQALAIIQSTYQAGTIEIKIKTENLEEKIVKIDSV